jgi:hypothetical protein
VRCDDDVEVEVVNDTHFPLRNLTQLHIRIVVL